MKIQTAVAIALGATTFGCRSGGSQPLKASIDHAGYTVTVRNDETQDWTNVRVLLNEKYRCPPLDVKAGETGRIRMPTCTTAEGKAFDVQTEGATKASVTVATAQDGDRTIAVTFP